MELYEVEFIANKVLQMWRNHPELCPHEYIFDWSRGNEEHYKCSICGHEEVRIKNEEGK